MAALHSITTTQPTLFQNPSKLVSNSLSYLQNSTSSLCYPYCLLSSMASLKAMPMAALPHSVQVPFFPQNSTLNLYAHLRFNFLI
jgi:hypothetical protein